MAAGRHGFAAVAAAVALAACAYNPPAPDVRQPPADYRKQILDYMPKGMQDVSGMRDTGITELALTDVNGVSVYTACVRYNPRLSRTEYEGVRERLAIFHGGRLAQFIEPTAGQCAKVTWLPFPEMEKLCLGDHCRR